MDTCANATLLAIIAAHFVADFWLQGDGDLASKRQFRLSAHLAHAATHVLVAYALTGLWFVWQIPVVVFASHLIIDGLKEASLRWLAPRDVAGEPVTHWKFWAIIFDQLLHLLVLFAMVAFLSLYGRISREPCWIALLGSEAWLKALAFLSGAVLAIFAGSVLIGILISSHCSKRSGARRSRRTSRRSNEGWRTAENSLANLNVP